MSSLIKGAAGPLVGAAAVRELTGRTIEETERRKAGVLHWRSFAFTIGCGAQGPNEGATTVIEHVTCTACLSAYTHNDYPAAPLPATADVENDGDRGPRAARDPLSVLDQAADAARAKAVQRLLAAVGALSVDEVAALAWVAGELPGVKLRRKCEEATATGWCGSDVTKSPPAGRRTAEDGTRAALLAAWRQVVALVHGARSPASEDLRQRTREDVLADEAARRAGGGR